mmetsp:Transcript_32350/g.69283  ORF Transcript_32350/g.69283 Transcript_32350/m.69283 type:complete len:190 (-) Transcript_32350:47-616(-)|eukprot:CAMPEP_0206468274 /NCGR_PEP_ID=MMETSP0324_2-20121206/29517_1 /ASSEMBLY_ACC=CAM_ASM_000836 /TAXON_ID=2866 /ORGANISM="Crypthecodinium cohnii, Strain Seligo" /LENGTH=189 /DNA_ID=CAMNT_0053941671 /DNA_START=32 /DNA_END=601 /DNA_ORIENTATION=+
MSSSDDEAKKAKKKAKKEAKKEKKVLKKVKKAAKKAKKAEKKMAKSSKSKKKKSSSSSSSSSSLLGGAMDGFVMDAGFGLSDDKVQARNPDSRIQRALGLSSGYFSFVGREDDSQIIKEVEDARLAEKRSQAGEDRSRDWICQKMRANGEACNARNFVKNETCYSCGAMRPRQGPTVKQVGDTDPGKRR